MSKILYIVVPCFNEEEVLPSSSSALLNILDLLTEQKKISPESRILFVDDGSNDKTWDIINRLYKSDNRFVGVRLSKNRGHQNALVAGLEVAVKNADAMVSIDADLQDDENTIIDMFDKYLNGTDIVYGIRKDRKSDTFFKRWTATAFYKVMKELGTDTVYNHADCRLMSKRAVEALLRYKEHSLFLRGIVPQLGFKTDCVYYDRKPRTAGESKYPFVKMARFAMDGITSTSTKPLQLIFVAGITMMIIGILVSLACIIIRNVHIVFAVISSILVTSGIQIVFMGVIGEYIGRIYTEAKDRPRYEIETILASKNMNDEE